MSNTPQRYPKVASLSPRLDVVDSTGSTNADLVEAASAAPRDWPHLSVILTTDQRSGRGRLDRTWTAPAGAALAVSTLVRCGDVPIETRGWLPLLAGAAMTRAVAGVLEGSEHTAQLKWPNDVLVDGAKLCGILAEVIPGDSDAVVIGIGVNTRMTGEQLPVPTATSFAVLGVEADLDDLVSTYLTNVDEHLGALAQAKGDAAAAGVLGEVQALCATLGRNLEVSLPDGTTLRGRGQRIESDGRLVVDTVGGEVAVSAGDVVHVR